MRLTSRELQKIGEVLGLHLKEIPFRVFLFGSRTDDQKKGGDIDLLLQVDSSNYKKTYEKKSFLKFGLEEALGDQRVDLTLATPETMETNPFLRSIRDDLLELSDSPAPGSIEI